MGAESVYIETFIHRLQVKTCHFNMEVFRNTKKLSGTTATHMTE